MHLILGILALILIIKIYDDERFIIVFLPPLSRIPAAINAPNLTRISSLLFETTSSILFFNFSVFKIK